MRARALRRMTAIAVAPLGLAACAAPSRGPTVSTGGCVAVANLPEHVALALYATVTLAPPCPRSLEGSIRGPIQLTATEIGLRVRFNVAVAEYSPGSFREESNERDVVMIFPRATGPGEPSHQLSTARAPGGYTVDDVVPWSVFGLRGPGGRFRFTCAVFDRYGTGSQVETRISFFATISERDAGAPPR